MPVTPLDDMQTAAVFHQLSECFDRFKLSADIKEPLRDYFRAKGRGVTDLPWDVDTSDEDAWGLGGQMASLLGIGWKFGQS